MRFQISRRYLVLFSALALLLLGSSKRVSAQVFAPLPLVKAAAATELPLGAWGPYSQKHLGPCCLVNRSEGQLFAFPLIVGQQRDEVMLRPVKMPDGKTRIRPAKVVVLRRMMGLSPVNAASDTPGKTAQARITEADADGLLWAARAAFTPAPLAQPVVLHTAADGTQETPAEWGEGTAVIEYFPAFADPDISGLLIRVTLTNASSRAQSYFVDMLSGIEKDNEAFAARDLNIQMEDGNLSVLVQHPKCATQFAAAAKGGPIPPRFYRVGSGYLSRAGSVLARNQAGEAVPAGQSGEGVEKGAKREQEKQAEPGRSASEGVKEWGLTRLSDIVVEPGQSRAVWLSVGIGPDAATATNSVHSLLRLAGGDGRPESEDIYEKALAAHRTAVFSSGDSALDRLAAQSLANTPFHDSRRVGVPSREAAADWPGATYRPGTGGWIALGWSAYRPDWAAAQLNAWFVTQSAGNELLKRPLPVPPIDSLACWELFQKTHDREMLERFYPSAKHRYIEFVEAGRLQENGWLFAWPGQNRADMRLTRKEAGSGVKLSAGRDEPAMPFYAPDYSAYVLCAAKLLRACARVLNRPQSEIDAYTNAITAAGRALNISLWDSKRNLFTPKAAMSAPIAAALTDGLEREANGLDSLLPLIAGPDALSAEQNAALLKHLADGMEFWGDAGLRSVAKGSAGYRPDSSHDGAIHYGAVWLFWKALLDRGESEKARILAANVLRAYHSAFEAGAVSPEFLNGDTGKGLGRTDYSGDACALLPLYAAYHAPGTVTTGWELSQLDSHYEKANDTLRVVFRLVEPPGKSRPMLLCVLGKSNGKYTLTGALAGEYAADGTGVLTLAPPLIEGTQQIEIAPAGSAK